jgi:hypothetical protein
MSDIPKETKPEDLSPKTGDDEVKNISAIQGFMEKNKAEQSNDLANDLDLQDLKNRPKPPYVEVDPTRERRT